MLVKTGHAIVRPARSVGRVATRPRPTAAAALLLASLLSTPFLVFVVIDFLR
ncbi:MAG: hypothetical protein N4A61_05170 [Pelagimonas sp.]|jgi:hypothetical protein|nr:hypothetical protein [Pelagimonas sp.]